MSETTIDPATQEALWSGFRSGRLVPVLGRLVQEHQEELPTGGRHRQLLVEGLAGSAEGGAPISLASVERLAACWQIETASESFGRWAPLLMAAAYDRLGFLDPVGDPLPFRVVKELGCAVLAELAQPAVAEARPSGPWEIPDRGEDYDDSKTVLMQTIDEAWLCLRLVLREAAKLQ